MVRSHPLSHISLLTVANLWASASSLVLFALAAQALSVKETGSLALLLVVVNLLTTLADLGLTGLVVRSIASSGSLAPLRWTALRRVVIVAVLTYPAYVTSSSEQSAVTGLLVFFAACFSSLYAAQLSALLALQRVRTAVALQGANGVLFIGGGVAVSHFASIPAFLLVVGVSYMALVVVVPLFWVKAMRSGRFNPGWRRQVPFIAAVVANSLTASLDSLMLGTRSKKWVAEYASAQRPGLAFAALSNAVMGVMLPRFVSLRSGPPRSLLLLYFAAICFGTTLGLVSTPVLAWVFPSIPVDKWLTAAIFAAYAGGVVTTMISARVLAAGLERLLMTVAWVQLVVTASGVAAVLDRGPVAVAFGVLGGRIVGFGLLNLLLRKHRKALNDGALCDLAESGSPTGERQIAVRQQR